MRKLYPMLCAVAFFGSIAGATIFPNFSPLVETGAIKSWSSGETLHSADLNSNFNHIHSLMVGGHGARLVDADVSPSANIALSKLALTPALVPKAVAMFSADACTGANTCTENITTTGMTSGVASITHQGATGIYTVAWSVPRADAYYSVLVTPGSSGTARTCLTATQTVNSIVVGCYVLNAASTAADGPFQIVMLDNL